MPKKKLVTADAATFDPAKSYEVEVRKVAKRGTLTMRPAFNPYVVSGAVAAEIVDSIRPDTVRELTD